MKFLQLASDMNLPLDAVTQKLAWLGRTGSGKTYGAKRLVEQMLRASAHVVVLDPVGVWPGLRLGSKSFDVPVLGGLYGDVPLEPTAGAVIADLAVDHGSLVIDVSQMLDAERTRFARAFAQRFFQRKKSAPGAVHLVLEECQDFVPQNPQHGEEPMLHEFQRIAKQGRSFGIGVSLISQRPQEINKKALNQSECVFAFQMTGPQERKALEYWLSDKGFEGKLSDILPRLEVGAPHVWSPQWLKVSRVVRILPISSIDTSSTPKVGEKAFSQRKLEPIDLKALEGKMAETIERAKADDPKALRARIAELEKAAKGGAAKPQVERIHVPVFDRAAYHALLDEVRLEHNNLKASVHVMESKIWASLKAYEKAAESGKAPTATAPTVPIPPKRKPLGESVNHLAKVSGSGPGDSPLGKCERALLTAIVQHERLTLTQASIIAGYSTSSSTPGNAASKLRGLGFVDGENTAGMTATPSGVEALGEYEPLPVGAELARYWLGQLGKCEAAILRQVLAAHPDDISLKEAAEAEGYSLSSSTPGNAASKLRTLCLIRGSNAGMTANERLV